jgi:hypothetical protein
LPRHFARASTAVEGLPAESTSRAGNGIAMGGHSQGVTFAGVTIGIIKSCCRVCGFLNEFEISVAASPSMKMGQWAGASHCSHHHHQWVSVVIRGNAPVYIYIFTLQAIDFDSRLYKRESATYINDLFTTVININNICYSCFVSSDP